MKQSLNSSLVQESHLPRPQPSERRLLKWLLLGAFIATLIVHWPAISARAVSFDDHQYLLDNSLVKHPSARSTWRFLSEVRKPSSVAGYYQPLSMISLMTDVAMGGGPNNFAPIHRTSLLLHAVNTGLVGIILFQLFGMAWPAAIVALVFGLHPLAIEPTAWVGERKTVLASFFAFLSIISYLSWCRAQAGMGGNSAGRSSKRDSDGSRARGIWRLILSVVLFLLALMSKPTVVPLPVVLILLDWWPMKRLSTRTLLEKIPFLILAAIFAYITVVSQGTASVATMPTKYPASRVPLVLCHNIVFYLMKMIWPAHLSSHYPFPSPMNLSQPMVLAGLIGTAVLLSILAISLKWTRALVAGWLIFFFAILPTMQIIGFSDVIASDKYAYFPSLGILLVLAWALSKAWKSGAAWIRPIVICLAVLVPVGETYATREHLPVWKDTITYYDYMLKLTPNSAALHNNLAVELASMGRFDESIQHYRKALEFDPDDERTITNLGVALEGANRRAEAIELYQFALHRLPNCYSLHVNLSALYVKEGKDDLALEHARLARLLKMDSPQARALYANGLYSLGKMEEAAEEFREALELGPDISDIHNNYAATLEALGKKEEALQHYGLAAALDPRSYGPHQNAAVILASVGRVKEAFEQIDAALRIDPVNTMGLFIHAQLTAAMGKRDEAVAELKHLLEVDKGFLPARELIQKITTPASQPATSAPAPRP
ncbi:MAG TPA: tetratricopeptide repeat protein [Phycisphaerae bacterium]|nr:tetratricopeptide repeat protein [Phycisphaerae bacterium]